jgi:hypothetical protein
MRMVERMLVQARTHSPWAEALPKFGPVLLAASVYAAAALPLRHWLVDDAAISMAYAANWAAGASLVAQPGIAPVEGYSDFLWVVVLAGLSLAGMMTVTAIKIVSGLLVSLALLSLNATCKSLPLASRVAALLLVASNSSVVTWTTSGLENPLTLLISCELVRCAPERRACYCGILVGAMALTRPEGILFGAFPLLFVRGRQRAIFAAIAGSIFATFLAFRYAYFGDLLPNTFYAKEAAAFRPWLTLLNGVDLLNGPFGSGIVFAGVLLFVRPYIKDPRIIAPLGMMAIAGGIFALMPPDWMPDRRFGTAFVPAASVLAALVLSRHRAALMALVCVSVIFSGVRLANQYRNPTVPVTHVIADSLRFNAMGGESILLPDIGGALLTSRLRVYDLAGLTDRTIARTLYKDKPGFHDYVFRDLKPTYIKVHTVWTATAAFDQDPRFARDYASIGNGEYVRRDRRPPRKSR